MVNFSSVSLLVIQILLAIIVIKYLFNEKRSFLFFVAGSITIFVTPQIMYMFLDYTSYKVFGMRSFHEYQIFGIFVFIVIYLLTRFDKKMHFDLKVNIKTNSSFYKLFQLGVIVLVLLWVLKNFSHFGLFKLITTGSIGLRSDTTGLIPHRFLFSILIDLFLVSFWLNSIKKLSVKANVFFLICLCILICIDGSLGLFTFFAIFMLLIFSRKEVFKQIISKIVKLKFSKPILIGLIIIAAFVGVNKGGRLFLTQGAGLPNRIELVNKGVSFTNALDPKIDEYVFKYVYRYDGGAYPTFFSGNLMLSFSMPVVYLLTAVILTFIYFLGKLIDEVFKENYFLLWNYCFLCYLFFYASITYNFLLYLGMIFLNILSYIVFCNYKNKIEEK